VLAVGKNHWFGSAFSVSDAVKKYRRFS